MNNHTPALVAPEKKKFSLKSLFFGNRVAKNTYYAARHKTENIYLLWIQCNRFGTLQSYPCVLSEPDGLMVYMTEKAFKEKNHSMVERWALLANPETFARNFDYNELMPRDFNNEYNKYQLIALGYGDEVEPSGSEQGEPQQDGRSITEG